MFPQPPPFIPCGGFSNTVGSVVFYPVSFRSSRLALVHSALGQPHLSRRSYPLSGPSPYSSDHLPNSPHPQALGSARFIMPAPANATTA
ncbi:hypothetical protein SBV1_960045 [Verrucomicrobia bacterium]|nr:hypothetical protein SBV1_960045 [Verrucomicrobiota bacterium]